MVQININDKKYEIPERITIDQYSKILKYSLQEPQYYPKIVQELTGIPLDICNRIDEEQLYLAVSFLVLAMNKRTETEMLDVSEIKLGQFVDLDILISGGVDKNFSEICKLLTPNSEWADEGLWAIEKYNQYRTVTYRQYKTLFGLNDNGDVVEDEDNKPTQQEVAKTWYKIIVELASLDPLKIDRVTELGVIHAFNFMALKKEQAQMEAEQQRKQKRQYDLQANRR